MPGMIGLVVALEAEARPLRERLRLRADTMAHGFRVYRDEHRLLIVSGVGRVHAAAAVGYLAAAYNPTIWLNIGLGGHRSRPLGEIVLAHAIRCGERHWYPPPVFEPPCPTATVTTADRPEILYPDDCVYEMETAGFYSTACRFTSAELIQVLKVISDNAERPPDNLKPAEAAALIDAQTDTVLSVIERLRTLARIAEPPSMPWLERVQGRLSVTERRELAQLARRLHTLEPDYEPPLDALHGGGELLDWLRRRLAGHTALRLPR